MAQAAAQNITGRMQICKVHISFREMVHMENKFIVSEDRLSQLKFGADGLIPTVAQDVRSGDVVMLAYMNMESLRETLRTRLATYFSRSRKALWQKGATSGNVQHVREIVYDCDGDALLLKIEQTGVACHTGEYSCFHNSLTGADESAPASSHVLEEVFEVIQGRKANPVPGSYTNYLLDKGVEKICKKVGEEASETIIAAVKGSRDEVRYEASDLLYHLMVLLCDQGMRPEELYAELRSRRK